jgi:hypothetical protein
VIYLVQGATGGIVGLALDAYVIWALVQNKELFSS